MKVWGTITKDGGIAPYTRFRPELLEDFKPGERLKITIDKDRNGRFSALFHLALSLVARAINRGPAHATVESLKQFVKLRKGWYDVVELPKPVNGQTHAVSFHSTAFASMGEAEFHRFAHDACRLICDELAPWIEDAPEWREAQALINQISPEE